MKKKPGLVEAHLVLMPFSHYSYIYFHAFRSTKEEVISTHAVQTWTFPDITQQ